MANKTKRVAKRLLQLMAIVFFVYLGWFLNKVGPVLSAYGAKNLCDAIYLQHRKEKAIIQTDLSDFPFWIPSYRVNYKDSSVTGSIWGTARRKAIFRTGSGVTLVNDFSEAAIRQHPIPKAPLPIINTDSLEWPAGDRLKNTIPDEIDTTKLNQLLRQSLAETKNGKNVGTRAMLVVYNGEIVGEMYAPGFNAQTLLPAWSVTKSITGCLVGLLVKSGQLNINQPVPLPEWQNSSKHAITIKNLLQQTSGLDYEENYYRPSEATHMLFNCGDAGHYAASLPLKHSPGTVFNYSSGNTNILSLVIRNTVGEKNYAAFPYDSLLYKIGMYTTQLEPDASGTYVGSSWCYATARDYARLGLFYYNKGNWLGEQLLPEHWVTEATQAPATNPYQNYGFQLWLNGFKDSLQKERLYPTAPLDMFYANGYAGQYIFIIPGQKLVVVRLGLRKIDEEQFITNVLRCVKTK